ncbi:MAG: HEAT repeat domain-containing protein, partial [bacterium]
SKTTALLVQMLEHPSAEIREAAGLALVKRGDARGLEEVVPAVRKGLLDDSVIKGLVKINNLRAHELLVLCVKSLSYGTSNQVAVDSLRIWEHRWGKRLKK